MSECFHTLQACLAGRAVRLLLAICLVGNILLVGPTAQGFAPDKKGQLTKHSQASTALDAAHAELRQAQAQAKAARAALDDFLSQHFEMQQQPDHPPLEPAAKPTPVVPPSLDHELQDVEHRLGELRAKRKQLLETLTLEHPEVVEVEEQIQSFQGELTKLQQKAEQQQAAKAAASPGEHDQAWSDYIARQREQSEADAAEYQKLFDHWEEAQLAVEKAWLAVSKAEKELASTAAEASRPTAEKSPVPIASETQKDSAPPTDVKTSSESHDSQGDGPVPAASSSTGNHTFALAALAVALAVAALAAVRLARSSADPLFASADEAAAALAIPVVGIVPATSGRLPQVSIPLAKLGLLLGELLLAVAVFTAVAYGIEHLDEVWQFFANPVTVMRGWFGI